MATELKLTTAFGGAKTTKKTASRKTCSFFMYFIKKTMVLTGFSGKSAKREKVYGIKWF